CVFPVVAQDGMFGEVIGEYETIQGDPAEIESWVVWDAEACEWKDVTANAATILEGFGRSPDSYTAILRAAGDSDVLIAWTPEDQVFDTLIVANKSFADTAELTGLNVPLIDNAYPSVEIPFTA